MVSINFALLSVATQVCEYAYPWDTRQEDQISHILMKTPHASLLLLELVLVQGAPSREAVHVGDGALLAVGVGKGVAQVDGHPGGENYHSIATFLHSMTCLISSLKD